MREERGGGGAGCACVKECGNGCSERKIELERKMILPPFFFTKKIRFISWKFLKRKNYRTIFLITLCA